MKTRLLSLGVVVAIAFGLLIRFQWQRNAPRRHSLEAVLAFAAALNSGNAAALLQTVVLPPAVSGRTPAEQTEFLTKALRDEISPEGLAVLQQEGQFGSLTNIFPTEAKAWADQAGVKPEDCVAFKLEHNGVRAEVVLVNDSALRNPNSLFRIVRCNNVKQLAQNL